MESCAELGELVGFGGCCVGGVMLWKSVVLTSSVGGSVQKGWRRGIPPAACCCFDPRVWCGVGVVSCDDWIEGVQFF